MYQNISHGIFMRCVAGRTATGLAGRQNPIKFQSVGSISHCPKSKAIAMANCRRSRVGMRISICGSRSGSGCCVNWALTKINGWSRKIDLVDRWIVEEAPLPLCPLRISSIFHAPLKCQSCNCNNKCNTKLQLQLSVGRSVNGNKIKSIFLNHSWDGGKYFEIKWQMRKRAGAVAATVACQWAWQWQRHHRNIEWST